MLETLNVDVEVSNDEAGRILIEVSQAAVVTTP
jgi:hypothetical protein